MGRHSAPDDDTQDTAAVAVIDAPESDGASGRHSQLGAGPGREPHATPSGAAPETQPARAVEDPEGLDLIEEVLEDEPPRGARRPAAPPAAHPDAAHPDAATTQIPAIIEPVADAPLQSTTTDLIPVITEPILDDATTTAPADAEAAPPQAADAAASAGAAAPVGVRTPSAAPQGLGHHGSAADLTLVRRHADVRARCIAALIVPFLIYVAVLYAVGLLHDRKALFFLFAPLIAAGILVGVFLDLGHKRYPAAPPGGPSPGPRPQPGAVNEPSAPH